MKFKLYLLAFGLMIFASSCKDECEDVICGQGTCNEGICDCPENYFGDSCETYCLNGSFENGACTCDTGYEGESCEVPSRDKFLGSWFSENFSCNGVTQAITFDISAGSDGIDKIFIKDPDTPGGSVVALVSGNDIVIESQSVTIDGEERQIEGSGLLDNNSLSVTFNQTFMGQMNVCLGTFVKQ